MKTVTIAAGSIIYREGEKADAVFVIEDGEVEVLRQGVAGPVRLAVLGRGEIFGETGVIMGEPRSTTMRARVETRLLRVERDEFIEAFSRNNPIGLPLLRMLCQRLAHADRHMVHNRRPRAEKARLAQVGTIRLLGACEIVTRQIGEKGIAIRNLPFTVGAKAGAAKIPERTDSAIFLDTDRACDLSPNHFAIARRDGYLILRDLGSRLGTIVNGQSLSRYAQEATAVLHFGPNEIIAGAKDSPIRFQLVVAHRPAG